jgi:hypothetical protein
MSFTTGSANSVEDLVVELFDWAVNTAGWTQNELDTTNNYGTLSRNSCFVSFRWDSSPATDLGMYQSLGWSAGNEPHEQLDDSGNGDTTIPINLSRRVNFKHSGPFPVYHFFAPNDAPYYIHVVVEYSVGSFRHLGFGELEKIGDWTGGEYVYGHLWDQTPAFSDSPASATHSMGLDGVNGLATNGNTLHAESLPFQDASSKWVVFTQNPPGTGGTDRAGNPRGVALGTTRGGLFTRQLSWLPIDKIQPTYKPLCPIDVVYRAGPNPNAPEVWSKLGVQRHVAICNLGKVQEGESISLGGEPWIVFPWTRKQFDQLQTEESRNAGIAYRKVT